MRLGIDIQRIATLYLVCLCNCLSAQTLRIPINYFDLLPMEAQWLIEGEGLLNFEHRGNYSFYTALLNGQKIRSVQISCSVDSIRITEVQNIDTITTLAFRLSNGGISIKHGADKHFLDELFINTNGNIVEVLSNTKRVFAFEDNFWRHYPQEFNSNIFGTTNSLESSLYLGNVYDRKTYCFKHSRVVYLGEQDYYYVSESAFPRFKIENSMGFAMKRSGKYTEISKNNVHLKIRTPPIEAELYMRELIIIENTSGISIVENDK